MWSVTLGRNVTSHPHVIGAMIPMNDRMRWSCIMKPSLVLVLVLALAPATATAQVYQRIGPNGEIHFSDQPGLDAQPVEVRPAQTVTLPSLPPRAGSSDQQGGGTTNSANAAAPGYTAFTIVSPAGGEGVRANDGNVTIRLSLEPELVPGHVIRLNLDGEDGEQIRSGGHLAFPLTNLSRGRHSVEAQVMDDKGNVLMRAGPVSFYVLRFAGG